MLRKTLTFLSLVGLMLTLAAWVCSYLPTKPEILWGSTELSSGFGLYQGKLQIIVHSHLYAMGGGIAEDIESVHLSIVALFFAVALIYGVLPGARRIRRKRKGLCLKCGYDLRASKDRCPECGTGFIS